MVITPGVKYILLSTVYFAIMNVLVKYLQHIPSVQIVWMRSLVTLVICLYMIWRLKLRPFGNNKPFLIARGLAGAMALLCYFYSLQHMPLANAVTIQYMSPVFTAILAIFILRERMRLFYWGLLGTSLVGVALIKGFDARVDNYTLFVGLSAAFCSGLAYNFVRKLKDTDHPLIVVFYFPLVTLPVVTPVAFIKWHGPSLLDWLVMLGVGIFTQLGQLNMTKAYMKESASKVAGLTYIGLIFAIAFGYILFDEELEVMGMLGMMIIVGSVVFNIYFDHERKDRGLDKDPRH